VELGVAVVEAPGPSRKSSSRRNVTDIGSRRAEEAPRRSSRRDPREAAASGTEGMPRTVTWARAGDNGPGDTDGGDPSGRARYRPEGGGSEGPSAPRAASNLTLGGRAPGAAPATATVTPPSGRPAVSPPLAPPSTPPGGNAKAAVASPPRSRQASPTRSSRSRARTSPPASPSSPPPPGGQALSLPTSPPRGAPVLPTRPVLPTGPGPALATAAELTDDTGGGRLAPGPMAVPPPSRAPGNPLQSGSLPIPDPPRGPLLPPSLDTGRLGPSPLPTDTGQIPAVAASALPPDLSWAAEDDEAPIAPPLAPGNPRLAPAPAPPPGPLGAPGRMPNGRHEGDAAPHVVAMSPDARAAVESTVGRSGGGQGGPLQIHGTQEQILGRGHLLHFLATVRTG
jgi:hypothetical protein